MGDSEEFKIPQKEVAADVVETAKELELEVDPEGGTALPQSREKTLMGEGLLFMDQQRKWFPEMESIHGENAVNLVEMPTKDLEYYINLVDKAAGGCQKVDSSFHRRSLMGMWYCMPQRNLAWKEESVEPADFIVVLF